MVSLGCKIGYITGLSIVLLLGIVLLTIFPLVIYPALVKPHLKLEESSAGIPTKATYYWQKPPAEFTYNFYMFNVTNPDEASFGAKPVVNEIGPYVWREWESKDTEYSPDKTLVAFKNDKAWHFDEAASCASCKADDLFYQPTLSLLATANAAVLAAGNMTSTQKLLIDMVILLMGTNAYNKATMEEHLFLGYSDPLLELSKSPLLDFLNGLAGHNVLGFDIPKVDYLGYFPQYNHTADENYVSYTGKDDYHKMGLIQSWANSTSLDWWNSDIANNIDGASDGTSFGGFVDKEKNANIRNFQSFIGRILPMTYSHESSVKNIKSYYYKIDDEAYDTTRESCRGYEVVNELNTTYFPDWNAKNGLNSFGNVAFPPGVIQQINFPGKKKRIPFFVTLSAPHFFNADEVVVNTVDGLSPSAELHNLGSWQIQPTVGSTLSATFRMQTSVAVFDSGDFTLLNKIRPALVPAFWLEVNVNLRDYALDYIRMSTKTIPLIVRIIGIVLTALAVLIAVGVCLAVCFRRRKRVPKMRGIVSYS